MNIAFAGRPTLKGDIKSALMEAGFTEKLYDEDHRPVTHYALGETKGAFYAEFLTPLTGSGIKRNRQADSTISTAGITAQKLRHLEILLIEPWSIFLVLIKESPSTSQPSCQLQTQSPLSRKNS